MVIDIKNESLNAAIKKFKAREAVFHQLEKVSGIGSWEVDLKTKMSLWSDKNYDIYKVNKGSEINLKTFFERLSPNDVQRAQRALNHAINTAKTISFTTQARREDGVIITVLINAQIIYDENQIASKLIGTTQDITPYISLQEHASELSKIIEHSSSEIYIVNLQTLEYLYVNKGACDALGYTKDEMLVKTIRDINPYLKIKTIDKLKKQLLQDEHILHRTVHQRKDSSHYHVQSYIHTIEYKGQSAYVIFDTDITQMIKLESEYKKQANILKNIHDSVISTDIFGNITSWNKGSQTLFGYKEDEIIGKYFGFIYDDNSNNYGLDQLLSIFYEDENISTEAVLIKKDASKIACILSLNILRDEKGIESGYIGYIHDITEQKETQKLLEKKSQQLRHQAYHDTLTGLANRLLFKDRLEQTILHSKRNNRKFALLFIDLDQFKKINDSLGHDVGDRVLIEFAQRLIKSLREEDSLARLGGDEFTVILKDVQNTKRIVNVATKIIDVMKESITVLSNDLHISCSIGISIYPDDATSQEHLIKYADAAMYKAKDEGRNNYQFYSSEMTLLAYERVIMENSLRIAIKEEQFIVHFQPQFEANSKKIVGMEALVRWHHPKIGLIFPNKFITIAEETGLIVEIDKIVMQKAMKQFSKWYKNGFNPGILALNLSMKQLNKKTFIKELLDTMQENNFDSKWLELEVTESQVMNNPDISIEKLNTIHNLGIEIAIDDFGTGYSSLSYLKKLPLDKLKIDKSFIDDIPECEDDIAITKAIIALAHSLGLKLIAEGVETKEQLSFLIQNGCEHIQGYYFSKPISSTDITKLLEKN